MPKAKQFNREKVLEVSAAIFQQKGYNGTSIDEILKATGLSRSSLYDSFKDKHTLYLQALEFYNNAERHTIENVDRRDLNGLQKIEHLFRDVVQHLIKHPADNGCLMVNAASEMSKQCEKTAQVICNNKDNMQELFTNWLAEAQKNKVVSLSNEPGSYAPFLFNSLCGLKILSQSGATEEELNEVVNVTMEAIV
jgi:TetR/AcrR family transcriptional repressor of nem operon